MAKKILLADDSITIQKVISITFASEDYELIVVGDGEAAIRKIKEIKPDLVMADVAMPGRTGYEVCEAIKNDSNLNDIPVLLLAGTFEPLNKDEAARVKADDSIVKPFESQELLDKVSGLLAKAQAPAAEQKPISASPAVEAAPVPKLDISDDIWEAGDFLGFSEELDKMPEAETQAPDLGFLESGLFEEPEKELSLPDQHDFMNIEFREEAPKEEKKISAAKPEEPAADVFGKFDSFNSEPFEMEHFDNPFGMEASKGEPAKTEAFDLEHFDHPFSAEIPKEEPAKIEPFEMEPFDLEPFKAEKAEVDTFDTKAFWEDTGKNEMNGVDEAFDTEILEMPQEDVIEVAPSEIIEEVKEEPKSAAPLINEEPSFDEKPFFEPESIKPLREIIEPQIQASAAPQASEAEVSKAIEGVVARVEARFTEEMNVRAQRAEEQIAGTVETAAAKFEARIKDDLYVKMGKAEAQVAQAIENAAGRVEQKVKTELDAKLERSLAIPKEQIAEIVRKSAREIIEQVAWEVIPELAEELIKAEINKVKEALIRTK